MAKTIELKPCPFCGQWIGLYMDPFENDRGEVFNEWYVDGHTEFGCIMDGLLDDLPAMDYDEALRFAEKWNHRAERMCKLDRNDVCNVCGASIERVTHSVYEMGDGFARHPNYCPNCGAKVAE